LKIGTPKEVLEGESRVAMTPDSAVQLQKLGFDCAIEAGAGAKAGFSDADYKAAGVEIIKTPAALWKASLPRLVAACTSHVDRQVALRRRELIDEFEIIEEEVEKKNKAAAERETSETDQTTE